MSTAGDVRAMIIDFLQPFLAATGISPAALSDDTDLRAIGLVDSLRFVQLLGTLQDRLPEPFDLSNLSPDRLTILGDLAKHIGAHQPSVHS
jgi:hypothetical protein